MEDSLFAYSLSQSEHGWSWRLWDVSGDVVAAGEAPDQISAHRRLMEAFEKTQGAAAADGKETRHAHSLESPAGPKPSARLADRRRSDRAPPARPAHPDARAGARP
jgi:hypothetical protein